MATAVEQAIDEIQARFEEFTPELEGLYDYQRLNLHPDSRAEVDKALAIYERRKAVLVAAYAANRALMDDGHPELAVREISMDALKDLQANAGTIEAALKKFGSNAATSLNLNAGEQQPK